MMETPLEAPLTLPFSVPATAVSAPSAAARSMRRITLAAAITGVLVFAADHDWFISRFEDFTASSDVMQTGAAGGNLIRGSALFVLGAVGLVSLFRHGGYKLRIRGLLGAVLLAIFAWCAASWFWSIEPAIAMRRLVATLCVVLAALAAAKHLTPRELAAAALSCALAFLAIGVFTEIALGTFQPWRHDYRFSGTLHPNHQGLVCAMIVMAATYLGRVSPQHCKKLCGMAAVGLMALWMTKSRTSLAALVMAEALYWLLVIPWKAKVAAILAIVGLVCAVMLVSDDDFIEKVTDAALLGRGDEEATGTLSGRVSLWEDLSESIAERPLAGFGFNSFWIPKHIEDISDSQSWAISVAHSTYLDLTLGIGLIGTGLCVTAVVLGCVRSFLLNATYPGLGYGFIAVLLLFVILQGLLESAFANPGFAPLVAYAGLAMLAFVDPHAYLTSDSQSLNPES